MFTTSLRKSDKLYKQSKKFCTSGTQTYSKSANRYVEGVYPYFIEGGNGAFVYDLDGNQYIDYPCALGAVVLGYSHPYINDRVISRIERGTIFSMPSVHEMELARVVNSIIPSMESVRFLKSGSEAVSAAIKIARSFTGRDLVLSNGYHGWHDWSTPITDYNSGTPSTNGQHIMPITYNDYEQLESIFKSHGESVACIVIDPYIFSEPQDGYLTKLVRIAHKYGALVIFDEVVTGIRWSGFSVQNNYGIKPDLTCLGKTMANGIPISCVGGKRQIMEVLNRDCFVSSTYGGDLIGIEGALATLKVAVEENLPEMLFQSGSLLQDGFNEIATEYGLDASCVGNPARQRLDFPTPVHKAVFWQECLKRGVFLGAAQHTNLAHTEPLIEKTLEVFRESLSVIKKHWDKPKRLLEGRMPEPVMAISNLRK